MEQLRPLLVIFTVLALSAVAGFLTRNRESNSGELCQEQLKNICRAMEAYASDNMGLYPKKMENVSKYLKGRAECKSSPPGVYSYIVSSDSLAYTISCSGSHGRSRRFPCVVNQSGVYPPPINPAD